MSLTNNVILNAIASMAAFVAYVTIFLILLKRRASDDVKLICSTLPPVGMAFGMLSYALVSALNSVEAIFMDTRDFLHILFIGPFQEEFVKFTFFLLAYVFIMRRPRSYGDDLSEIREARNLVVLGAYIGLTLAFFENLIDYSYLKIEFTLLRTVISWPLHIITIGISAYGFNRYIATLRQRVILYFLTLSILIHIFFNAFVSIIRLGY